MIQRKKVPFTEDNLKNMNDADLVQQVQKSLQGQTAFAELYRRHVTFVYRYLLARVGNVPDAQDLTTQTFMAALEGIVGFRGKAKFSTWLIGIARNQVASHYRRQRPVEPLETAEALQYAITPPDEGVEQQLRLEAVIHKMQILSDDRAEALSLHSFGGLEIRQVAEIMEKSEAAVRMLIHRGIQDLKQRLQVETQEQVR